MAGIQHLADIYDKKGKDFVQKLFDREVTVNEKLDASAFAMEKGQNGELLFYKRNTDIPISLVDRTIMRLYEKPIQHFTTLDEEIKKQIPVGWRFGMEYFIDEKPQTIAYDRIPKNNLVLSYIHIKNSSGKVVRTVQDKKELDRWAELLDIEKSPIVFQGHLDSAQKIKILDFLDTPFAELTKKFSTKSFVKYVITTLNPKLKKTALNNDLDKSIEGLVFRFDDGDGEVISAKMVDPVFEEMAKERTHKKNDDVPNEIYQLTVIDLMNFIEGLNLNKYKPKGRTQEERYLNFICSAYNAFIEEYGNKYKDLNFNEPDYLKKKEFDLNLDFIPNDKTLEYITDNDSYKKLFKIMLATFRKKKKRPTGMLSSGVIKQFNTTVDKVHNHLSYEPTIKSTLTESEVPTFGEFIEQKGRYQDEEDDPEMIDFITFRTQIEEDDESTEDGEEKKKPNKEGQEVITKPGKKKVNIIVGRFQPFHNGHLGMATDMMGVNKLPCVIVAVHPGHTSKHSPFQESTMKTMLANVQGHNTGNVIDGVCFVKRGFVVDVFNALRKAGYEPVLWGAGEDRIHGYQKQIELNFKRDNELNIPDDFELLQTNRYGSGEEVRKAIEADDFGAFKHLVPKPIAASYHMLRNDLENFKREEAEKEAAKEAAGK